LRIYFQALKIYFHALVIYFQALKIILSVGINTFFLWVKKLFPASLNKYIFGIEKYFIFSVLPYLIFFVPLRRQKVCKSDNNNNEKD